MINKSLLETRAIQKITLGTHLDVELSHDERMTLDALAARVMGDRYDTVDMAGSNS